MTELVWLVTGCSSGFGEAFVHSILARGDKVIATGRNAESRLAHLKGTGAAILDLDVTSPQEILDSKIQEAIAIYGKIDVLINNAAYGELAFLEEMDQKQWLDQFNTNFFGVTNVTRAILPHFRGRRSGKIAFMSSLYSWKSDPALGPYSISKHAIVGYASTLRDEVSQFNIHPIVFDIGHFRTKVSSPENLHMHITQLADYEPMFNALVQAAAGVDGFQPGDPKKGVDRMIDVLKQEGAAQGRPLPFRMPIGPDALAIVREQCHALLKTCDEWEDVIASTDFEGPKLGAWAEDTKDGGYV